MTLRDDSPPPRSYCSSDRDTWKNKSVRSDFPKSKHSTDMSGKRYRPYSSQYQEWDDERKPRRNELHYSAREAEKKKDLSRSRSRGHAPRRPVSRVGNKSPDSGYDDEEAENKLDLIRSRSRSRGFAPRRPMSRVENRSPDSGYDNEEAESMLDLIRSRSRSRGFAPRRPMSRVENRSPDSGYDNEEAESKLDLIRSRSQSRGFAPRRPMSRVENRSPDSGYDNEEAENKLDLIRSRSRSRSRGFAPRRPMSRVENRSPDSGYYDEKAENKLDLTRLRSRSRGFAPRRPMSCVQDRPLNPTYLNETVRRKKSIDPESLHHLPAPMIPRNHDRGRSRSSGPSSRIRGVIIRPQNLRRPKSTDKFDQIPHLRYGEFEHYGPPTSYHHPPFPRYTRQSTPPRRYRREPYDDYDPSESHFSGDENSSYYPEEFRERGVCKYGRSRSRVSRRESSLNSSSRSDSSSSSRSSTSDSSTQSRFPKKGKTRMPTRLVDTRAIFDLGYSFEQEGEYITIMKALGRDNIDEVIHLSEKYRAVDRSKLDKYAQQNGFYSVTPTSHYTNLQNPAMRTATIPPPPMPVIKTPTVPPSPVSSIRTATIPSSPVPATRTVTIPPLASPSSNKVVSPLSATNSVKSTDPKGAVIRPKTPSSKDERDLYAEIKILEAEKEALRAQLDNDRLRHEKKENVPSQKSRENESRHKDITVHRDGKRRDHNKGIRIKKDRKGPSPRMLKFMLKTLT